MSKDLLSGFYPAGAKQVLSIFGLVIHAAAGYFCYPLLSTQWRLVHRGDFTKPWRKGKCEDLRLRAYDTNLLLLKADPLLLPGKA